ncbi:PRC-barrel domain-containing protein [Dietzia psychralcaliphila]|uniref:PRC-barrel domain-containing protein n=1 Tax=Dietzia psychralcaliphila TaxID=139021 RepID=A0AAD0JNI1_9ACTN|nr:PRC-barrel domain-containing protein [Dietzia psychralcaliphila]AWH94548.1 hypothetical protein A6048_02410 [Dietzia psychralcaliphila]PTM84809.1 PRC-barrel domain protein [Dietzia psychralcaliphila]
MTLKDQLDALLDATAFDSTGTKIGAVRQVYVDDASGKITFATVSTGIFSSDAIVPLHGARLIDDELHVDHTRAIIRDSPRPDHTEDALTPDQEHRLLEYYGIEAPVRGREASPSAPGRKAESTPGKKPTEKPADTPPETKPGKKPDKAPAVKKAREADTPGDATQDKARQDKARPDTRTPTKSTPAEATQAEATQAEDEPGTKRPGRESRGDAVTAGEKSPEGAAKAGGKSGVTTTRSPETTVGEGRRTGKTEAPEGAGGTPDDGSETDDSPGREPRS